MVILLKPVNPKDAALVNAISTRIISLNFEDTDAGKDELKLEIDNTDLALLDNDEIYNATSFFIQWGTEQNLVPQRK